jgi:hypothetical protein
MLTKEKTKIRRIKESPFIKLTGNFLFQIGLFSIALIIQQYNHAAIFIYVACMLISTFPFNDYKFNIEEKRIVVDKVINYYLYDDNFSIYVSPEKGYNFHWSEFSGYSLSGNTLLLVKPDNKGMIIINEEKTGVRFFQAIFYEAIERLDRK